MGNPGYSHRGRLHRSVARRRDALWRSRHGIRHIRCPCRHWTATVKCSIGCIRLRAARPTLKSGVRRSIPAWPPCKHLIEPLLPRAIARWNILLSRMSNGVGSGAPKCPCLNQIQQWGQAICNSESRTYRVSTFGIGYGVSAVARDVDASGNGSRGNETGISLSASLR